MLAVTVTAGADMAIRQGKVLIQNAEDFYAWAKQTEENGSKIKYLFHCCHHFHFLFYKECVLSRHADWL
jgi:hypothetical protein